MRYTAELYTPDGQERQKLLGTDYGSGEQAQAACDRYAEAALTWEQRGQEWWARGAHWWLRVAPQAEAQEAGPEGGAP